MGLHLEIIPLWPEGTARLGRSPCLQHQLQFGSSHGKCSHVGGARRVQDGEFRCWRLLHKHSTPLTADHTSVGVGDRQLLPGSICGHGPAWLHPLNGGLLLSRKWNKDTWLQPYQRRPFLLLSSPSSSKLLFTLQSPAQISPPPGSPPS